MIAKAAPLDPVLAALESAPLGEPETEAERAAVLASMAESGEPVPHDEVIQKLNAARR